MKVKHYCKLSFAFDYRVLSGILRIKDIYRSDNSMNKNDTLPSGCLLKRAGAGREREDTPTKQQ
jgi:hypothetical protein